MTLDLYTEIPYTARAEQNALRKELSGIAADYRASVRAKVAKLRWRQP